MSAVNLIAVFAENQLGQMARITRVLADADDIEQAPTLIARLGDADLAVVRQANEALRQLGRKLSGYDLSEHPSPAERQTLIEKWKGWYLALCPNAEFPN